MRPLATALVLVSCAGAAGAADPPVKRDRYGDPLPTGALVRLGTFRTRAPITGFGIAKDGTVVTVGPAGEVRRWKPDRDRSDDPIPLPLPGPPARYARPQVSPDGALVAVATADKVFVWEAPADAKAKPKQVAEFSVGPPRVFRFSPDGSKLLVAAEGRDRNFALLCDIKTGEANGLEGDARFYGDVGFSGDGSRAAGVGTGKVVVWEVATGKKLAECRPNRWVGGSFALDAKGEVLVVETSVPGGKSEWQALDPLTGKVEEGFNGPPDGRWVAFAPDGKTLLAGGPRGATWWDPAAGQAVRTFPRVASDALRPAPGRLTPDGKTLVVHNGFALLRWRADTGRPLFPEQDVGHAAEVNGLGVSPDGKLVATRGEDGRVRVWDFATGRELWRAPAQRSDVPYLGFSPDGKHLYVPGPEPGEVTKHDAATGKAALVFKVDPEEPRPNGRNSARLSADGKTLFGLSGAVQEGRPGLLTTWDAATGERVRTVQFSWLGAPAGELSPDGRYLAQRPFAGQGVVAVADPGKDLLAGAELPSRVFAPGHFSDDGKWLTLVTYSQVKGAVKGTAVVVSTPIWRVTTAVPMPASGEGCAALSPDGRTLAAAAGDRLEFFDAATAKPLGGYTLPVGEARHAPGRYTHAMRFTPDGTKLVSGHADTTALVWPVPLNPAK